MGRSVGHIRFTVEERILLHLLDFTRYRNKIEVPIAITQQGISQCIRIERKHLPRSLKAMHGKNLLEERTTHVKNKPQRMKTYYLTLNGEAKASELKEGIMDFTIRIKEFPTAITQVNPDLVDLIEMVTDCVATILEIPKKYLRFMPKYLPSVELAQAINAYPRPKVAREGKLSVVGGCRSDSNY